MNREFPLLHDHHTHPLLYSVFRRAVDLSEVQELEHACELITQESKSSSVVVAHSWKDNFFDFSAEMLDRLPACAIFNISLHKLLINSSGRRELSQHFGEDVAKVQDQDWFESNLRHVLNWFALLGGSAESLFEFYQWLETVGIHSAEEMLLIDGCEIDWYVETELIERTRIWSAPDTFTKLTSEQKQHVAGFKLFADGAFGSRTAAISQAYCGQPTNFGIQMYSRSELLDVLNQCAGPGVGLAIHAIGDVAIELVVGAIEAFDRRSEFSEIRIEHAQLVSKSQAQRIKNLGIKLSMQPNFNEDSLSYRDRLPEPLLNANNPFRMLIDECEFVPGVDLLFGSDGMPHGADFAAEQSFDPPLDSQRLSAKELVDGYSRNTLSK